MEQNDFFPECYYNKHLYILLFCMALNPFCKNMYGKGDRSNSEPTKSYVKICVSAKGYSIPQLILTQKIISIIHQLNYVLRCFRKSVQMYSDISHSEALFLDVSMECHDAQTGV